MTAKREHDLASAKRLIVRAAAIVCSHLSLYTPLLMLAKDIREANIPTAFHSAQFDTLTTFPRRYALYPFMSPRTLLWTMGTGGAFRARKVNEWMAADDEFSEQHGLLHGTILTPAKYATSGFYEQDTDQVSSSAERWTYARHCCRLCPTSLLVDKDV